MQQELMKHNRKWSCKLEKEDLNSNNNYLLDSKTQRLISLKSHLSSLNKESHISSNNLNSCNNPINSNLSIINQGSLNSLVKIMKISMMNSMILMKAQWIITVSKVILIRHPLSSKNSCKNRITPQLKRLSNKTSLWEEYNLTTKLTPEKSHKVDLLSNNISKAIKSNHNN